LARHLAGRPGNESDGSSISAVSPELREQLNMAREREKVWRQIIKEPLFHFLKYDPEGRTILCLFANGQISHGKCAEAIVEKFCLGLTPTLPEWKGYTDAQK
jgi:hypothetical protein